jgi:hypothetical protein
VQRDAASCAARSHTVADHVAFGQPVGVAIRFPEPGAVTFSDPIADTSGVAPSTVTVSVTGAGIALSEPLGPEREREPFPRQR